MTMRLAGVALAAMVAYGWASGAEASTISASAGQEANAGYASETLYYDTITKSGSISFYYYNGDATYPYILIGYGTDIIAATFTLSNTVAMVSVTASTLFQVKGTDTDGNSIDYSYFAPATIDFTITPLQRAGNTITGIAFGNFIVDNYGSATIELSTVPLPSSAPLFGAALLALGGATYARRRSLRNTAVKAA